MNPRRILSQAALVIGALVFSIGLQAYAATFAGPASGFPNSDAVAPLDTGTNVNVKVGGLLINSGGALNGLLVANGNVGIGTVSPASKLDVNGEVKVASSGATCTPTNAGAIRFSGTQFEGCMSSVWTPLTAAAASCPSGSWTRTTPGPYTLTSADVPACVTKLYVTMSGGGGGGGGGGGKSAHGDWSGGGGSGGGGGAGSYIAAMLVTVTASSYPISVSVGAGGAGGANSPACTISDCPVVATAGQSGNSSSFGGLSVNGGSGGGGGTSANTFYGGPGGSGGSGGSGGIGTPGSPGNSGGPGGDTSSGAGIPGSSGNIGSGGSSPVTGGSGRPGGRGYGQSSGAEVSAASGDVGIPGAVLVEW